MVDIEKYKSNNGRLIFSYANDLDVLIEWNAETFGKILSEYLIEEPAIIRFGQQTADEAFVVKSAAEEGVVIENPSEFSSIVMLKHFNGGNSQVPMVAADC